MSSVSELRENSLEFDISFLIIARSERFISNLMRMQTEEEEEEEWSRKEGRVCTRSNFVKWDLG